MFDRRIAGGRFDRRRLQVIDIKWCDTLTADRGFTSLPGFTPAIWRLTLAPMELRQLKHLIAIIEHGSVSAAAKALDLTQPALTRSMNALEQNIGEPLLLRGQAGAQPTAAGSILYQYAKSLVAGADNVRVEISRLAQGLGGVINVGIGSYLAELLMPPVLARFSEKHSRISINICAGRIDDLVPMLLDGEVEVVVSMVPRDKMRPELGYERFYLTETAVYAGQYHRVHAWAGPVSFNALREERWVSANTAFADAQFSRLFADAGGGFPDQLVRSNSNAMMRAMIEQEGFIGIMPSEYMAASTARRVDTIGMPVLRGCGVIFRADQPRRAIISDLLGTMRATAETLGLSCPTPSDVEHEAGRLSDAAKVTPDE